MTSYPDSTATAVERTRDAMNYGVLLLAAARGILLHANGLLPPTDPRTLARMEAREIPYDLPASLRRQIDHAVGHKLEEAMAELDSALEDTPQSLEENWRGATI